MTEERLAGLFRAHYGELLRYLLRRGEDWDTAEDIVQSAFVRLAAEQRMIHQPRSYLFELVRNRRIDLHRVQNGRRHLQHAVLAALPTVERRTPEVVLAERAEDDVIAAALTPLAPHHRALMMGWAEGLTYGELSTQTGVPHGTIGTTLTRLRKRLRRVA